jgi:methylphosphotriester-DNA--protein-cysteine methyltransferase
MIRLPRAHPSCPRALGLLGLAGLLLAVLAPQAGAKIYADKESHLYHIDTCPDKEQIKPKNLRLLDAEEEARSKGFYPCEKCIAPNDQPSQVERTGKKLSLQVSREQIYVGQRSTKTYHYGWCTALQEVPAADRVNFSSPKMASQKGYQACAECSPPAMYQRVNPEFAPAQQTPEPVPTPPAPPAPNQLQEGSEAP